MDTFECAIGEAAGKIWDSLSAGGSMSKSNLAKATGLPTNLMNQGIGWLAREGKLQVVKQNRYEMVALKE